MRNAARPRSRLLAALPVLVPALVLTCAGCTHETPAPAKPSPTPSPSHTATSAPPTRAPAKLRTRLTAEGLPAADRADVRRGIARSVTSWLHGGYLAGPFPRHSYPHAFESFTAGARRSAAHRAGVMTGARYAGRLMELTPVRQTADVTVWVRGGRPAGADAKVRLVAVGQHQGGGQRRISVSGTLQLTPSSRGWEIFGFDVHTSARRGA